MSYCLNPDCLKPENVQNALFCVTCGTKLLLKDRYRAIKPIGQGGFGRTLLAVDEDKPSKPPCIVKQFLPQAQATQDFQKATELFEQEALRLDRLGKHQQIPTLLAYLIQENRQYLVQEYIEGDNLADILAEQGVFNESQIWELLNSFLPVLEYIHNYEVIHRDIKPQNMIRSRNGELFLVDFGAAKVVTGTAIIKTGTSIGTPEFVAPEQSRGKPIYSSDLYSLGVTCIHLLTHMSPFDLFDVSENNWVWRQYLVENPVSEKLSNILDKLIENATSRRYCSASEVLQDIYPQKALVFANNQPLSYAVNQKLTTSATIELLTSPSLSWQCIQNFCNHTGSINSIAISPDGMILASGSNDNTIKLWDISTNKEVKTLKNETSIYAVAFSPDGSILASGDFSNNIQLRYVSSGEKIRQIKGHKGWIAGVNFLSFSPDGCILASAGGDKTVKLWDISTGQEILTLQGHDRWVGAVAISPDGKLLASGSADKTAIIWDLNTGKKLHHLKHTGAFAAVRSVAFSPNGEVIATGSEDYTIKLWQVRTGQEIYTLQGHENWVRYVTFSPNGKTLASSSYSDDIKLWNLHTKQEISTLTGHLGDVNSLVFSPDGLTLFSGSEDKTIKVWRYLSNL